MKRILPLIFLCFLAALLLPACSSGSASASLDGSWSLVSVGAAPSMEGVDANLTFDGGKLSGNVGCNSFGGDYKVSGTTVTVGPIMSTMMACPGNGIMEQESAVQAVLQGKFTFELNDSTLTLTSEDGSRTLVLRKK